MDELLSLLLFPGMGLLLYLTGLVLALIYWRRCPAACSLLLCAVLVGMLRILVQYLWARAAFNLAGMPILVFRFLEWVSYGLMLMAIFAGRNEPTRLPPRSPRRLPDDDEPDALPLEPPVSTKESTGIQVK